MIKTLARSVVTINICLQLGVWIARKIIVKTIFITAVTANLSLFIGSSTMIERE